MTSNMDPQDYEPVFASDHDWHCNACLNWTDDALELYVIGYKHAADNLVAQIVNGDPYQDALVFPICFLYRQYIELRLKEIVKSGRSFLDENGSFPQHHKIQNLWNLVVTIINKVFSEDSEPLDLSIASHVITEFSKLDPGSFTFRYPIDKSGKNPLENIRYINVRRLANYINAFADTMDVASTGISVYLDHKREMISEYID